MHRSSIARLISARLPFPIEIARRLRPGQAITVTNFSDNRSATGYIRQILPALNTLTQTTEVIVEVRNPGAWRPAGSVRGEVVAMDGAGLLSEGARIKLRDAAPPDRGGAAPNMGPKTAP